MECIFHSQQYPRTKRGTDSSAVCKEQGLCCDNDPTPAGVMISHAHAKTNGWHRIVTWIWPWAALWRATELFQAVKFYSNTNATPKCRMNMHMFMLMYGITDRLTVMGMLHYNSTWMKKWIWKWVQVFIRTPWKRAAFWRCKVKRYLCTVKQHHRPIAFKLRLKNTKWVQPILKGKLAAWCTPNNGTHIIWAGTGTMDVSGNLCYQKGKFLLQHTGTGKVRATNNAMGTDTEMNMGWLLTAYHWLPVLSSSLRLEAVLSRSHSWKWSYVRPHAGNSCQPSQLWW